MQLEDVSTTDMRVLDLSVTRGVDMYVVELHSRKILGCRIAREVMITRSLSPCYVAWHFHVICAWPIQVAIAASSAGSQLCRSLNRLFMSAKGWTRRHHTCGDHYREPNSKRVPFVTGTGGFLQARWHGWMHNWRLIKLAWRQ